MPQFDRNKEQTESANRVLSHEMDEIAESLNDIEQETKRIQDAMVLAEKLYQMAEQYREIRDYLEQKYQEVTLEPWVTFRERLDLAQARKEILLAKAAVVSRGLANPVDVNGWVFSSRSGGSGISFDAERMKEHYGHIELGGVPLVQEQRLLTVNKDVWKEAVHLKLIDKREAMAQGVFEETPLTRRNAFHKSKTQEETNDEGDES